MKWKQLIHDLAIEYCHLRDDSHMNVREFYEYYDDTLTLFAPNYKDRYAKVRQQFIFLREENQVTFVDNQGNYILSGVDLSHSAKNIIIAAEKLAEEPEEREYLVEVRARNQGLTRLARRVYGDYCLIPDCANTFQKENDEPYIEVHHIQFLCHGGKNNLANLSVVCAHHHRAAHFARFDMQQMILDTLQQRTQAILSTIQLSS